MRDDSLDSLIKGVKDYQEGTFSQHRETFEKLTEGQKPKALFITCSDSRVDPTTVTGSRAGDLFIIRNAGNIIPPYGATNGGEGATVEYALMALNIQNIIVCGHSHCGAMQGLMSDGGLENLPNVASWLGHARTTRLVIKDRHPDLTGEPLVVQAGRTNVLVQLDNLKTHPSVALRLAQGKLKLHAWIYTFERGEMLSYDQASGEWKPLQGAPELDAPVADA